jgi:lysophospholipase L1-like esterase
VFLVSLGLSLLAGELFVRRWIGAPLPEREPLLLVRAHPTRGWEMVPGSTHYTYHHRVAVNALGLRGPELGERRDEQRVLFLGDSLTYGQGVADTETVPAALEAALRAQDGGAWTVVNGGLRAYGTTQELALLEELGPRIQPEVVLLGWYWNDVRERPVADTYAEFAGKGEFYFDTEDRLEGRAWFLWRAKELVRRSALVMLAHDVFRPKGGLYLPEVHEQGLRRFVQQCATLRATCARLGALPVVVVFPDSQRLLGGEATRSYEERTAAIAREQGLAVIELLPALQPIHDAHARLPVLPFDGHYDAEANRAMGAYLAERLLALGVPKRAE